MKNGKEIQAVIRDIETLEGLQAVAIKPAKQIIIELRGYDTSGVWIPSSVSEDFLKGINLGLTNALLKLRKRYKDLVKESIE